MFVCLDQRTGTGCGASNHEAATHCRRCGRSLRFATHLLDPGSVVGHYRVLNILGHGGFGAVYAAEDTRQPGSQVALKETFDPATIRSFQGEFAVLRNLQHPHLPRYYEMFEAGENGYLVMELVPGQSLQEVLNKQRGPLIEEQVLGYALQLCSALAYLHSQTPPILHRDIKPANVRLTPEGLIKLVDFGLLKQGGGQTQSSRRGLTPAYAPIEQWGETEYRTDQRSDLYSLAATLYHLLTGRIPPAATDRMAAPSDPLQPPRTLNPALSSRVSGAIVQAMALRQQDRLPGVTDFKRALVGADKSVPPATPLTPRPTLPRLLAWLLGGAGLFLSLALLGLLIAGLAAALRGATPDPAVQPTLTVPFASPAARPTVTPTPPAALGNTRTRPADGMVMVYVPAGTFQMGSTEYNDQQPVHSVTLDGFWIDEHEVTVAQFRAFVEATGHWTSAEQEGWSHVWVASARELQQVNEADWAHPEGPGSSAPDDHPVTQVSWVDAAAYCAWAGGGLPTEAEWEYAARGVQGYAYPWGNTFDGTRLNYCDNNCPADWQDAGYNDTNALTAPVESYPGGVSWCGALNMAGNVWEWVADWYGDYTPEAQVNPAGPTTGDYRVLRGGGWVDNREYARTTYRISGEPGGRNNDFGFRCRVAAPRP